ALVGISFLSSEITQASQVKVIKQDNYCIMLEEGEKIILAVMIKAEAKSLRKRMVDFISDFESLFEKDLKNEMSDSEDFESTSTVVEKFFIK
ncbi:MAG: hypothetical protein ACW98F_09865, partial [Candidatus Hodarchaeales archaeon]